MRGHMATHSGYFDEYPTLPRSMVISPPYDPKWRPTVGYYPTTFTCMRGCDCELTVHLDMNSVAECSDEEIEEHGGYYFCETCNSVTCVCAYSNCGCCNTRDGCSECMSFCERCDFVICKPCSTCCEACMESLCESHVADRDVLRICKLCQSLGKQPPDDDFDYAYEYGSGYGGYW
jgi:hypothetical protein